jgi:mannosyltransferase
MQLDTTHAQAGAAPGSPEFGHASAELRPSRDSATATSRLNSKLFVALSVVVIVGFLLRLPTLVSRSVWMDEAYSYWFMTLSWADLWFKVPFYETHPPFYYSLLKLWTMLAGSSEAGMRSLSVLASLVTIALTGFAPRLLGLGKRYDRVGIVAALLLAFNAGSIEYAQQARPYALQTLFCTLMIVASTMLLKRMLIDERQGAVIKAQRLIYVSLGLCSGIVLWLHNTSPFIILGNWLGLFATILLFSRHKRYDLVVSIKALVIALVVWSPCVPITLIESRTVATAFWATISPNMLGWPFTLAAGGKFAFFPAIIVCALGWFQVYKARKPLALYSAAILLAPVLGVFLASYLFTPIFVVRTFEWMAPLFLFLVALGLFVPGKMEKLKFVILPIILLLCIGQDIKYYRTPGQDLRGAAQYLASNYKPGDLVLVYPNELEVGLHYYLTQLPNSFELAAIPARYPAIGLPRPYFGSNKGTPTAIDGDQAQIASTIAMHKRVWFVGDWNGPDGKMDVVTRELYRERGRPESSPGFTDIKVTLFTGK